MGETAGTVDSSPVSVPFAFGPAVPTEMEATCLRAAAVEDVLCQEDILSHVFASSCWLDPCWCYPYREPPSRRPTPAIDLRLLLRLRLICLLWRAVIDKVVAQPYAALDHSGCRWMDKNVHRPWRTPYSRHIISFLDAGGGSLAARSRRSTLCYSPTPSIRRSHCHPCRP